MQRRRRVPLRVLAAVLTQDEQEEILSIQQQMRQQRHEQRQIQHDGSTSDAQSAGGGETGGGGGGGLLALIVKYGKNKNGLFTTQDCAGVWYVERTFDDERINFQRRIVEYDATANLKEAMANPAKFSKSATTPSSSNLRDHGSATATWDEQKKSQETAEAFTALRPLLPCGFFIPLPVLAACLPSTFTSTFLAPSNSTTSITASKNTLADDDGNNNRTNRQQHQLLFNLLARMRPQQVDVRVFGDKPSDVFVRGVSENLDFDEHLDLVGEQRHSRYDIAIFAGALYNSLKGKGRVSMTELPNYLPPDLVFRLPLKQYHAILIFERMPHLFYVNTQHYAVEAKDFDSSSSSPISTDKNNPRDEKDGGGSSSSSSGSSSSRSHYHQPHITSLLVRTSPCPSELRFIVDNLTQPCPLHVVEKELPKFVRNRIKCFFASLSDFVAAHSAYLFLEGIDEHDDFLLESQNHQRNARLSSHPHSHPRQQAAIILNSHKLEQAVRDQQNAELEEAMMRISEGDVWDSQKAETMSEKRKRHRDQRRAAVEIAKYLPDSNGIPVHVLRQRLPGDLEDKVYKKHPRHFFDMFPDLFTTFVLYNSPTVPFVQHVSLPLPVNAIPRLRTEADLLRVLSFLCLSPRRLDVVFGFLPGEARYMIDRRYGASVLKFIQKKYARFFALFPDRFTGEPSAMYVGHYPEEQRESLRRKLNEESTTLPSRRVD